MHIKEIVRMRHFPKWESIPMNLVMCGVSVNTESTDTFVTDTDVTGAPMTNTVKKIKVE